MFDTSGNTKSIDNLIKLYQDARLKLMEILSNAKTKEYARKTASALLKQVNQQLEILQQQTNDWSVEEMSKQYLKGIELTEKIVGDAPVVVTLEKETSELGGSYATINSNNINILVREMQYDISSGLAEVGRRIVRYINETQDELLRQIGLEATAENMILSRGSKSIKNSVLEKLRQRGFFTIQYGKGKKAYNVPLETYAAMVARSLSREAQNSGIIDCMMSHGYDLVKISEHSPTCGFCAIYQGRVYSISGKDKRFPPLSIAFGAYKNLHPNCQHVLMPWIEREKNSAEIDREIENSNRPFEDNRTEMEKKQYKGQVDEKRRLRSDRLLYEEYKDTLGAEAPKTFAVFRRIKKENGDSWKHLQKKKNQKKKELSKDAE